MSRSSQQAAKSPLPAKQPALPKRCRGRNLDSKGGSCQVTALNDALPAGLGAGGAVQEGWDTTTTPLSGQAPRHRQPCKDLKRQADKSGAHRLTGPTFLQRSEREVEAQPRTAAASGIHLLPCSGVWGSGKEPRTQTRPPLLPASHGWEEVGLGGERPPLPSPPSALPFLFNSWHPGPLKEAQELQPHTGRAERQINGGRQEERRARTRSPPTRLGGGCPPLSPPSQRPLTWGRHPG